MMDTTNKIAKLILKNLEIKLAKVIKIDYHENDCHGTMD